MLPEFSWYVTNLKLGQRQRLYSKTKCRQLLNLQTNTIFDSVFMIQLVKNVFLQSIILVVFLGWKKRKCVVWKCSMPQHSCTGCTVAYSRFLSPFGPLQWYIYRLSISTWSVLLPDHFFWSWNILVFRFNYFPRFNLLFVHTYYIPPQRAPGLSC